MLLQNELYNIKITIDETYTIDSVDNRYYDFIYNPKHYKFNDFYKTLSIEIDRFYEKFEIALIGSYYSYDNNCAFVDNDKLTILQNDIISQICITDGSFILHKKLESFGCNYGIYPVSSGYIVCGEIEIMMLDRDFNKVWNYMGLDVFIDFEMLEHSIKLHDFEGNYYELDFVGNLINHNFSGERNG